jgi:hypothetical protein
MSWKAVAAVGIAGCSSPQRIASDSGTASSGRLVMDVTADKRICVRVKLSERYLGPIELEAASTESAAA